MSRAIQALTATQIKQAKPKDKDYKLSDSGGLYLLVTKSGGKHWKLKYKFNEKEKKLSLGTYPDITLSRARELREQYKQLIANGTDPNELKKEKKKLNKENALKDINTLDKLVNDFLEVIKDSVTPKYLKKLKSYYDNHMKETLGDKPIVNIKRSDILECIEAMQNRGIYESTKKLLNLIERVYKYAVSLEIVQHNIIADFDKKIVLKKREVKHHSTLTADKDIKLLMQSIENYSGEVITKYALKIIAHLALRPIELRSLKWGYINFKDNLIIIPANKMKMKREHIVPLTSSVKKMFEELHNYTCDKKYIFANSVYYDRYMSENTMNVALRRMGFTKDEMVSHGFRGMFSTKANDSQKFSYEVIETQLAHSVGSQVSQAYNRSKYLDERVKLMQWWSDYLDEVVK